MKTLTVLGKTCYHAFINFYSFISFRSFILMLDFLI